MSTARARVAVVTHYFSTHRGGVERVAGQLAANLAATGKFELTWVASDVDPVPPGLDGLRFIAVSASNVLERIGFPWPVWPLKALRELDRAIAGAEIVHIHDFIYFGNLAAFAIARRRRKPLVVTQHIGDIPYRSAVLRTIVRVINRTVGRFVLGRADQVVFISEAVRRQFGRFVRFSSPSIRIPNGVDTDVFSPVGATGREHMRSALGVTRAQRVVLYVGRFVDKKGLPLVHDLAVAMPDVTFWLAGWGAPESASHPSNWKLPNVTVFAGRSGKTLSDLYGCADLLVLPSISEGFPLVVQEAMSCGTPALVATSIADGAPEAGALLLTCPIEPAELAVPAWRDAIRKAFARDSGDTPGADLVDFARHHWDWKRTTEEYDRLFGQLLQKRKTA